MNEPNVLAAHAYLLGVWPPAKKSPVLAFRAQKALLARARRGVPRAEGRPRRRRPRRRRAPPARGGARAARLAARSRGGVALPARVQRRLRVRRVRARDAGLLRHQLLLARRRPLLGEARGGALRRARRAAGAPVSDLGWEIYPEGLGHVVRAWAKKSGLPVYITENGIADASDDRRGAVPRGPPRRDRAPASTTASTCAGTSTGRCSTTSSGPRATSRASVSSRSTTRPASAARARARSSTRASRERPSQSSAAR